MRRIRQIPFKSKPQFAFVVDGNCEFWYLQMLKRNEKSIRLDLKPEIPQKKKLKDQYEKVKELSKDYDRVFWIIDFDVINDQTRLTKKEHKTPLQEFKQYYALVNNISNATIVINNPCLEYWFLLHFETTSKYYDDCEKAIKRLKKYLPDYKKTQKYYTKQDNDIYLKLKARLNDAISNAKKLGNFELSNTQTGLTQMQILFEWLPLRDNIASQKRKPLPGTSL